MFLVEERKCLRVEGRGRSSRAKREPEGVPTMGEGTPKGRKREKRKKLSERAKLRKLTELSHRTRAALNKSPYARGETREVEGDLTGRKPCSP